MQPYPLSGRQRSRSWNRLARNPFGLFGAAVVLVVVTVALLAPLLAPFDPAEQFFEGLSLEGAPLPPNDRFLLGTDLLGRDLLSRLIYGARVSLTVGVIANLAALILGTCLGTLAGYVQGFVGRAIMRFTDVMMAFPALLLAIALSAILRPSLWIVALVIALVNWVQVARVAYAQVLTLSQMEFVGAAAALGAKRRRILLRHLFPHLIPTIRHTFGYISCVQGTRLGVLRQLLLALLAFVLAFVARLAPPPGEHLARTRAAEHAAATFLPVVLGLVLLAKVEKRRALLEQLGVSVHSHRSQPSAHNCKS